MNSMMGRGVMTSDCAHSAAVTGYSVVLYFVLDVRLKLLLFFISQYHISEVPALHIQGQGYRGNDLVIKVRMCIETAAWIV